MKNSLINSLIYSKVTRSPQSVFEKSFPQSAPDFFTIPGMQTNARHIRSDFLSAHQILHTVHTDQQC